MLLYAANLARRMKLVKHCTVMRIAVPVLIVSTVAVMVPSFIHYAAEQVVPLWLLLEMLLHGALGLIVVGIWVYVNLVQSGRLKARGRLLVPMRTAFVLWMITFIGGIHIFVVITGR
ncbi:MAG: hypothetical protein HY529_06170 [Chloroflexi bacterium]|nr:hypothetical protein [Chloroflexota bacterium]